MDFRFMVCAVLLTAAALVSPPAVAADPPTAFSLPNTRVLPVKSRGNGHDYVLYVSLPRDYGKNPGKRYPVVYTLDADYAFPLVSSIAGHFSDRGNLPPVIVVGIAYPGGIDSIDAYHRTRTRDYTPTHAKQGGYGPEVQELSGGGPAFLRFITDEVFPLIETRYRADPANRTFVGHSYGGLFGTYVLLTRPQAFRNYILVSPSLWYDDKVAMRMESLHARKHDDLPARVYYVVGSFENQPEHGRAMVEDIHALVSRLESRRYAGLEIVERVLEGETHNSVFPAGVTRGLRAVLEE